MNPRRLPRFVAASLLLPLLAAAASPAPAGAAEDYSQIHALYQQATAAYKAKDYPTYYARVTRLGELFPNDSEVIFRRAAASALTGRTADAERLLRRLAVRQAWFDVAGSPDFAAVRGSAAYRETVAALAALRKRPVGRETVAFRLAQKDFIPEAIAWDAGTGSFLLSSVYHRKVVRVGKDGALLKELVPEGTAGLGSALGIAVDAPRRALYVCSSTVKETRGARPEEIGTAALYAFHADSGKLLGRWPLGGGKAGHTCDSVGVSAAGEVYVSDGVTGEVSHLVRGPGKAPGLATVIPPGTLVSAQSLVFPPGPAGEKEILVADYGRGVFRIDLAARRATLLPIPPDLDLDGIDGMVMYDDSLIAVQNGLDPARVLRLRLSPGRDRVVKVETLARALPLYDEPGLATVAGGVLYYVANSQWGKFDDAGKLPATAKLTAPVILKIPL